MIGSYHDNAIDKAIDSMIDSMIDNTINHKMTDEMATVEQRKEYVMKKQGQCAAIIAWGMSGVNAMNSLTRSLL